LIGHTMAAIVLWIILGVAANAISTVIVALLIVSG
jgi:hypothetical protein